MYLKEIKSLTLDGVIKRLRAEVIKQWIIRSNRNDGGNDGSAGRTRNPRGRVGHDSRARGRGRFTKSSRFEAICYTCGEHGHKANNCHKGGSDKGVTSGTFDSAITQTNTKWQTIPQQKLTHRRVPFSVGSCKIDLTRVAPRA